MRKHLRARCCRSWFNDTPAEDQPVALPLQVDTAATTTPTSGSGSDSRSRFPHPNDGNTLVFLQLPNIFSAMAAAHRETVKTDEDMANDAADASGVCVVCVCVYTCGRCVCIYGKCRLSMSAHVFAREGTRCLS